MTTITVEKDAQIESDIFPLLIADLYELAAAFRARQFEHVAATLDGIGDDLRKAVEV